MQICKQQKVIFSYWRLF